MMKVCVSEFFTRSGKMLIQLITDHPTISLNGLVDCLD